VYELLMAGGLIMIPILACSVAALAIIFERAWSLRRSRVAPQSVVNELMTRLKKKELSGRKLKEVRDASPLGRILSSGLLNAKHGREIMKESIEEEASQVIHELERFLTPLGTIAAIAPLLGLLGTVIGMIDVFAEIQIAGGANNQALAGGISKALITTAAGLTIAIPALACHRYFQRRVDALVVDMEQQALRLVEVVHGDRDVELSGAKSQ
jgi:biopolymer transport protein ExbB